MRWTRSRPPPSVRDPPRAAWPPLLWFVPLTALWIVLIYWQPIIPTSGVPTTAHQLMAHGFIAVGLGLGLSITDPCPCQRPRTCPAVMIPYALLVALTSNAASHSGSRTAT